MTDKAKRFNKGKIDFTLLPVDSLEAEARVWTKGMEKYGRRNWEKLWGEDTVEVACASALRHIYSILKGEHIDSETGEPHAAHVRCNMAMLIRHLNEEKKDEEIKIEVPVEHRVGGGNIITYEPRTIKRSELVNYDSRIRILSNG